MLTTRLTQKLGIRHPIVQAPIGSLARAELAAAVCSAGGLGMLAMPFQPPEFVRAQIRLARTMTTQPFGVNFIIAEESFDNRQKCTPAIEPEEVSMAQHIATQGVHHFRLTVADVDRTVRFYTEVLGFVKLMDLNPGAFLSNGKVGLGIGPHPYPDRAIKDDRFDENRVGLDHLSFEVPSRAALGEAVQVLDRYRVTHSEIRDLGEAFGICIVIFRDPDNIQLELSGPRQ